MQSGEPGHLPELPTMRSSPQSAQISEDHALPQPNSNEQEAPDGMTTRHDRRTALRPSVSLVQILQSGENDDPRDVSALQGAAETIYVPPSEAKEHEPSLAARDIALPLSEADELDTPPNIRAQQRAGPEIAYKSNLESLSPLLPHLGVLEKLNVRSEDTGPCFYYDYDTNWRRSEMVRAYDLSNLLPPSNSIKMRFLFLEDLDPAKIYAVGSTFKIAPGFFASHLAGSGYCNDEEIISGRRDVWSRLRPGKGQFSMSWLRPVFLSVPLNLRVRERLLYRDDAPRLRCSLSSCQERERSHRIRTNRNIFRRPVDLSSNLGGGIEGDFPVGWEEKVSVWRGQVEDCSIFVVCLDPLPSLEYLERGSARALHDQFTSFYPVTARGDTALQVDDVMTVLEAEIIERKHHTPDSSQKTLTDWLESELQETLLPQEGLLRILSHDIVNLTEVIRASLQDIEEQSISLSPIQVQEHALHWRPLFGRFQLELRQLSRQLPAFVDFLFTEKRGIVIPPSSKQLLDDAENLIREASHLVERAYNSLRTELQIAEARRSIEEAESVAKLTELAFLFIPLTFAASLFSMQIKELQSSPPVSYFIATAIGFVGIAYIIRLAVRSSALKQYKRHTFTLIATHADLSEGEHPSTRQFLNWLVSALPFLIWQIFTYIFTHFIKHIIIALVLGLLAVPLVLLWRRKFDTGYSVIITLILLPMDLTLLWVVSRSLLYGDWKSKLEPKRKRRTTDSAGNSVLSSNASVA